VSTPGVSGQQKHDATNAVCVSPIPQYWDTSYNSVQRSAAGSSLSALCLLDLTAAFNTVDHQLLLHYLEHQFGLCVVVLAWFASYLTDRSFRVLLDGGDMSAEVSVSGSVPQGSVLGPQLFVLCMADLTNVVDRHNVKFHGYADDSQIYVHCQRHNSVSTISRLGHCITDIGHWMAANCLQMNPTKTKLLWTSSKHNIMMWHGSLIVVCRLSCTTNSTGWICQRGSPSSWASWRTIVCLDKHLGTSVPRQLHHPSHRSRISTTTSATFRQPILSHCASLSTRHIWPSGFFSR